MGQAITNIKVVFKNDTAGHYRFVRKILQGPNLSDCCRVVLIFFQEIYTFVNCIRKKKVIIPTKQNVWSFYQMKPLLKPLPQMQIRWEFMVLDIWKGQT